VQYCPLLPPVEGDPAATVMSLEVEMLAPAESSTVNVTVNVPEAE